MQQRAKDKIACISYVFATHARLPQQLEIHKNRFQGALRTMEILKKTSVLQYRYGCEFDPPMFKILTKKSLLQYRYGYEFDPPMLKTVDIWRRTLDNTMLYERIE